MVGVVSPFDPSVDIDALVAVDAEVVCRSAATAGERELCARIRHHVFVEEQGIFARSDRDKHDDDPSTIHILGLVGPVVGGTVRIYRLDEPSLWRGDRLAVLPGLRRLVLGKRLVQHAVHTAGALGGTEMHAMVQLANVAFFEWLGWERVGEPVAYHHVPHQKMSIQLSSAE
jgi:putative N-acetyltransferase (TIGR04045 family)